jgi:hypothetical protein
VGPVVVSVVHRLHEHDAEVQSQDLTFSFLIDRLVGRDSPRGFDQAVAADYSVLPQHGHARCWIMLIDLRFEAGQAPEVALLR